MKREADYAKLHHSVMHAVPWYKPRPFALDSTV